MFTSRGRLLGGGSVRDQAKILPEVKNTLVDHMRFYARPIVIAIFSFY